MWGLEYYIWVLILAMVWLLLVLLGKASSLGRFAIAFPGIFRILGFSLSVVFFVFKLDEAVAGSGFDPQSIVTVVKGFSALLLTTVIGTFSLNLFLFPSGTNPIGPKDSTVNPKFDMDSIVRKVSEEFSIQALIETLNELLSEFRKIITKVSSVESQLKDLSSMQKGIDDLDAGISDLKNEIKSIDEKISKIPANSSDPSVNTG